MENKKPNRFWSWYLNLRTVVQAAEFFRRLRSQREVDMSTPERQLMRFASGLKPPVLAATARKGKAYFTSEPYLEQHGRADWQNCDLRMMRFCGVLLLELRKMGYPFFILEAFRTPERQRQLHKAGRSRLASVRAPHCQGKAFDLVHATKAYKLTKREYIELSNFVLKLAAQNGLVLTWGGDWNKNGVPVLDDPEENFWDVVHYELTDWRDSIYTYDVGEPLRLTPHQLKGI